MNNTKNTSSATTLVIKEAMKMVSKDVFKPKILRESLVKSTIAIKKKV